MKKLLIISQIILFFLLSAPRVSAQVIGGQLVGGTAGYGSGTPCGSNKTPTALGCIPNAPAELVKWILKWSIIAGGGLAFILSLWGGVSIIFAAGNPEKINEGKEIIVSAISGLLFITLSVFLLRFIGYDILKLPGFAQQ